MQHTLTIIFSFWEKTEKKAKHTHTQPAGRMKLKKKKNPTFLN